jgi:hypothetical protein
MPNKIKGLEQVNPIKEKGFYVPCNYSFLKSIECCLTVFQIERMSEEM